MFVTPDMLKKLEDLETANTSRAERFSRLEAKVDCLLRVLGICLRSEYGGYVGVDYGKSENMVTAVRVCRLDETLASLLDHLGLEEATVPATKEKIIVSPKTTKATECEETQREAAKGV